MYIKNLELEQTWCFSVFFIQIISLTTYFFLSFHLFYFIHVSKTFVVTFYGWGSTASRLQSHFEETLYFLPFSSQDLLVLVESTSGGWRLSQPWSYPVVLNLGPLDWESTAITTRPLLHCFVRFVEKYSQISLLIDFWNLDISTLSPFPEHIWLWTALNPVKLKEFTWSQ